MPVRAGGLTPAATVRRELANAGAGQVTVGGVPSAPTRADLTCGDGVPVTPPAAGPSESPSFEPPSELPSLVPSSLPPTYFARATALTRRFSGSGLV